MKFFLHLKSWAVFLLTFGLFPLGLIFFVSLDQQLESHPEWNGFDALLLCLLTLQTLCMVLTNCWFYAIGTYLHRKYYYNSFVLVVSRVGNISTIILSSLGFSILPLIGVRDGGLIAFAFLISLISLVYSSLFSARLLKMAEEKRNVAFNDFIKEFVGFLFYPIGVWWLQPRINKIFEKDTSVYEGDTPLDHNLK